MAKRKKVILQGQKQYVELLQQTVRQLDSLIYDIETQTTQNISGEKLDRDLIFDSVPLIGKLNDARAFATESLGIYHT